MRRILATLALTTVIAAPVMADMTNKADLIRTRDIAGGTVYSLSTNYDANTWTNNAMYGEVDTNWNSIGEIEDIILNKDGQMVGIVAEVGGFLDIMDKHVVLEVDDVRLVAVDDREYAYVTRLSEEQLEQMESVDEGFWD